MTAGAGAGTKMANPVDKSIEEKGDLSYYQVIGFLCGVLNTIRGASGRYPSLDQ